MSTPVKSGSVTTLRVRPPELVAQGPSRDTLVEIAQAAFSYPLETPLPVRSEVLPAVFELSADDDLTIISLAASVTVAARAADVVIIDLMMDHTQVRFGTIEQLMFSAAQRFAENWPTGTRLVILMSRVPELDDDIAQIMNLPGLQDATVFIDDNGEQLGQIWGDVDLADRVSAAATAKPEDVRFSVAQTALRRRGVFKVRTSPRDDYAAHKYSVDDAELAEALRGYFDATGTTVVILDCAYAPWLEEAGHAAAVGTAHGRRVFFASDLVADPADPEQQSLHAELLENLADANTTVCVVVPLIKNGERVRQLRAALSATGRTDSNILAIFHAGDDDTRLPDPAAGGWASAARSDALSCDVHYLIEVTLRRLPHDHWQVKMAGFFNEDLLDEDPDWEFSRTGLWALLDEHHAESDYTRLDHGVLLRMKLDFWDARWLAASLIRQVRTTLGRDPGEMLLVMPDDADTAVRYIGDALTLQQGTTVLRIPRAVIDDPTLPIPGDVSARLLLFRHGSIILVDESTATYATLRGMARVVQACIERGADQAVVVLDLPEDGATPPIAFPLQSLFRWRPSRRKTPPIA